LANFEEAAKSSGIGMLKSFKKNILPAFSRIRFGKEQI
jgi:hypothetical protein